MSGRWLFTRRVDLFAFGAPFVLSLFFVGAGARFGLLERELSLWAWVFFVLVVDVAHVWTTAWRTYFDPREFAERRALYVGVPLVAWVVGVLLHSHSSALFWRVLAYVAVFHFIRQQIGWASLYRKRAGETRALDRRLDEAVIYASTLYPLIWWHAHLPRKFAWFLQGDFVPGLPSWVSDAAQIAWWGATALWVGRQLFLLTRGDGISYGKALVVVSTWACWWVGIVVFDSDYAFTVTNVLIHGVPYFVLVWWYGRKNSEGRTGLVALRTSVALFVLLPVAFALGEEALWDWLVWNDHPALFGVSTTVLSPWVASLLVPLLALPQATHYALDAFIWRTREDRTLRAMVEESPPEAPDDTRTAKPLLR